ncbi:helix-turn-helix domain-containing protein [Bradyrhizobium genosp. P]|uniref:AraC-like ligand-binding domain-containing protein n=1 Tax=Bradyrhizobium genosp. P TaxID=83641 RepID=UPI003CFA88BB
METVFTTSLLHPRERFDFWHSVACEQLVSHSSEPETRLEFEAEIKAGSLGNLGLVLFRNSPMNVSHTAVHVSRTGSDELFVCRQISGSVILEQNDREVILTTGHLTLLDPLLPYGAKFLRNSQMLVLKIPRTSLEARVGSARNVAARLITTDRAEDELTSTFSAMMPGLVGKMSAASDEIVANHILDLVAISLANTMDNRARVSSAKAIMLTNIGTAIKSRIADPDLDAQTVADVVGISVRYANVLLAEQGTSIGRLILAKRLARCRQSLQDPAQAHRTVSEIAYGWGFSDMTHFGRRFRDAYGVLPNEFRRLAKLAK